MHIYGWVPLGRAMRRFREALPYRVALTLLIIYVFGVIGERPAISGDHGAAKVVRVSPRLEARFDDQQLVLVYANRQLYEDKSLFSFNNKQVAKFADPRLVVFLENYIDGSPTTGAQIDLSLNFLPQKLEETSPGVYQSEKVILGGGRNEIEFNYKIGDKQGSMTLMLVIPAGATSLATSVTTSVPPPTVPGWVYGLGALVIYLIVTALFWSRRARPPLPPVDHTA
ncbi:MAG: hypothetical protein O2995_15505 [Proteobacteria bacterium]|nr:hypothetical protein [Pseudomonadota bacterium]